MKNILVVYQNIPDNTDLYLLNVDGEDLNTVLKCSNKYINDNGNNYCDKLYYWISDKEYFSQEWADDVGLPEEECGKFSHNKIKVEGVIDTSGIDLIVITGFVL